jgi:YfiH family protein
MEAAGFIEPDWQAPRGVHALVSTRAVGDLRALQSMVPALPGAPRWLKQVHGVAVADLDRLPQDGLEPVADAALTTQAGVVCVVRTADCLPVLLAAEDGSAVAAVHAGWRGLAAGVLETSVAALRGRMPLHLPLRVWLGPGIGPGNFEVGEEVRTAFLAADAGADSAFTPGRADRWMCDLYRLARRRLAALDITDVAGGGLCTYADEARFFSFRRDVQHRGLDATGRMAALIWRT